MDQVTLIDTDILIDAGREIEEAVSYLEELETKIKPAISVITQMELIVGCQSKRELRSLERFLSRYEVIKLNERISMIAVDLLLEYRLSHGLLIADALIAATSIHLDVPFVSKNQKDYRFISRLTLLDYPE
jgi:predicted nucleic acid-binding protein